MRFLLKKLTACVISFAMVCSFTLVGFAEENMSIVFSGGQLMKGAQIVIPVAVESNVGIAAADLRILYDSDNLMIKEITADYSDIDEDIVKYGAFNGALTPNISNGIITWATSKAYTKNGDLFWIVLAATDDVINGNYTISMTHSGMNDNMFADDNGISILDDTITVVPATITVTGGTDPVATSIEAGGGQDTIAVPDKATGSVETAAFTATVKNQKNGVMNDAEVSWSVENESGDTPLGVSISTDGVVTVTNKAQAGKIKIKAVSGSVSDTKELTITKADSAASEITVSGDSAIEVPSAAEGSVSTSAFKAEIEDQFGDVMADEAIVWSVESTLGTVPEGVRIDTNGVVTVINKARAGIVRIKAVIGELSGTAEMTVSKADSQATAVSVSGDSTVTVPVMAAGSVSTSAFSAQVTDQFGDNMPNADIVWSVETPSGSVPTGIGIDKSTGIVTVTYEAQAGNVIVKAVSGAAEGSASLGIVKNPSEVNSIEIVKDNTVVSDTETLTIPTSGTNQTRFTVKIYDQYGAEMTDQNVEWNITPASDSVSLTQTDGDAILTVGAAASDNSEFYLNAALNGKSDTVKIVLKSIDIVWPTVTQKIYSYGNEWGDIISLGTDGSASLNGTAVAGDFTVKNSSKRPDAGSQEYTIIFQSKDGQYTVEKISSVIIEPRMVTLSWSGDTELVYDGDAKNVTAAATNLAEGDSCTVTVTGGTETNAGTYTAKAAELSNGNYVLPEANTRQYTIEKAVVAIPEALTGLVYNGTEQTGVNNGMECTVVNGTGKNAGNYTATVSLNDSANYQWNNGSSDSQNIDWPIAKADYAADLSASTVSVKAGIDHTDFLPTAVTTGVNSESPQGTLKFYTDSNRTAELTSDAMRRMEIGDHKLYWSFISNDSNYVSDMKTGEITMTVTDGDPQNIEISGAGDKVYGDEPFALTTVITTTGGQTVSDGGTLTWESSNPDVLAVDENGQVTIKGVGTAMITVKASAVAGKYAAGSQTCEIAVEKRPVIISGINAKDKAYDGTVSAEIDCTTAVINGLAAGDELFVSAEGEFENANAGSEKSVLLTNLTLSGASAGNYILAEEGQQITATASITKNEEPVLTLGNLSQTAGSTGAVTAELTPGDSNASVVIYYGTETMTTETTAGLTELPNGAEAGVPVETTETVTDPTTGINIEQKVVTTYSAVTDSETGVTTYNETKVITKTDFTEEVPTAAGTYTVAAVFRGNDNIAPAVQTDTLKISAKSSGSSGGGSSSSSAVSYTITATAGEGGKISPASAKVKSGGDQSFTITASDGYKIKDVLADGVSVGAVSTYTFEDVKAAHTIAAEFEKISDRDDTNFTDVSGHWAEESIKAITEKGVMNGTGSITFSPNSDMTRVMLVTILWRLEGEPDASNSAFTDVTIGSWYEEAVAWANSNGIVKGFSNTEFGPAKSVTREQIAAILYRYEQYKGNDVSRRADLQSYTDYAQISDYAQEALSWANAEGLITGRTASTLDPTGTATRAEVATILVRRGL